MNVETRAGTTVAQSYMAALKACGIRHVFSNGGTDFAPIIEGILQNRQDGGDMPEFVTVPHEHVAVAMAQGYYSLALAVQEVFGMDPFCGAAFVFRSKRADRIKLLIWDQTGMVLVHKRLEGGTFVWPQIRDGVMRMSGAQFAALFDYPC